MNKKILSHIKPKNKKRSILLIMLIIVVLYSWWFSLKTENYTTRSDKINKEIKIVFISDLHNSFYGNKEQKGIISKINDENPDLVLFGGDIIDQYGDTDNAITLASKLCEKYKCYYTPGNHEVERGDLKKFKKLMSDTGVHVLDGEKNKIKIKDQSVTIYGILDSFEQGKSKFLIEEMLDDIDNDSYNILLAHQPELINDYLGIHKNSQRDSVTDSFDLILSGHAHSGQWRLPVILEQGVYAPDQGFFPDYTNGMFIHGDSVHIISRGLARPLRMILIPRIFNRPELSVISVK